MALQRLRITALRCVAEAELRPHAARNYIYGPNGAGKTTLLEGLYLLGRGRSFRTRQLRRLIQRGATGFAVFGEVAVDGAMHRLGVAWQDGKLERRVDGDSTPGTAALAEHFAVHVLEPGMHELIQGPPTERRRFLDWGVFHVEPRYLDAWRRYRRALGQRNAALKRGASRTELRPWTEALLATGESVHTLRSAYVEALGSRVAAMAPALLGDRVEVRYRAGWAADVTLEQALANHERRDRELGVTGYGPHRADFEVRLGSGVAQHEASRGQQKLAAAALVLAQNELAAQHAQGATALLVDDPAAELDRAALERLLAAIVGSTGQLFLTALAPEQLPAEGEMAVFHVERGVVKAL